MEIRNQVIELVENFLLLADNLLKDGKIDKETYNSITINKKRFLDMEGYGNKYLKEHNNE